MTKKEKELIEKLAMYISKHQTEHQDMPFIANALWELHRKNLEQARLTMDIWLIN